MKRRGFTLVELAIVLSITSLLVPLLWLFVRQLETTLDLASWHLESAAAVRTVSEQLEGDRRNTCNAHYALEAGALVRSADEHCGGRVVLARGVSRFERVPGGVELTLARRLTPTLTRENAFFLPLEAP